MFCVECGKEETFKEGVCIDCYIKSHEFTKGPSEINLPICPHCGCYKHKNTWTKKSLNDALKTVIKSYYKIKNELKNIDIKPICKEIPKGYECKIQISGCIEEKKITEEHNAIIKLEKIACDTCSKQFGGYHEAIIQVRTGNRKLSDAEIEDITQNVINQIDEMQSKGNRAAFISDILNEHGGIDFFISEKQIAEGITKKLKSKYGGEIKKSSKNIGMKDSRQVYRMTYLLRLLDYKTNDYIKFEKNYYKIISMQSNKVKLLNLSNLEEHTIEQKKLEDVKILTGKETIKEMIVISQNNNEIQLMDTENYETIQIKKPNSDKIKSKKICVIFIEDNYFLLNKNYINDK